MIFNVEITVLLPIIIKKLKLELVKNVIELGTFTKGRAQIQEKI
jgi:hypothetical protein